MDYAEHLAGLIRKSTFKLSKYKNGWIDPTGQYHSLQSHHHVEEALKLIKHHDCTYESEKWFLKQHKKDIESAQKLIHAYNDFPDNFEFNLKINKNICKSQKVDGFWSALEYPFMHSKSKKEALKLLNSIIEKSEESVSEIEQYFVTHIPEIEKFKRANKNKGYDAAEYIIVHFGYIAVEDGYLLYRNAKNTQLKDYNCYVEKDEDGKCVICKLSPKDIAKRDENQRKKLIKLVEFYSEPSNRFHCPSGFTRGSYERWLNECRKVGLDGDELIYNKTFCNY